MGLNWRKLALAAGLGIAAASWAGAGQAAEVLRGYTYIPVQTLASYQGLERIASRLEEASGGEVTIKLSTGGSLPIKATDVSQAVSIGTIDFASDGFFMGLIPAAGILRLPFLLNTPEEFESALATLDPYLEQEFEKRGIKLLAHYRYPLQIAWSTGDFRSFEDLADKKVRVTSPEQAAFVQSFDGIPVTIGSPEVATAFQTGVISVAFTSTSAGGNIWKDFLKSNYRFGPNWFNSAIIINKDTFDGLPKEVQDALVRIAAEEARAITDNLAAQEAALAAKFEAEGKIAVTSPTDAQIQSATERMKGFWVEWAKEKGGDVPELLAKVRAAIGK